jgi:nucleolin
VPVPFKKCSYYRSHKMGKRTQFEDEDAENSESEVKEDKVLANDGDEGEKRKRKRKRKEKKKGETDGDAEEKKASSTEDHISPADVPGSEAFTNDRTLYLEGLPFEATEMDVRTFFKPAGGSITSCRLPTWHDSGRLRGYGHVEFDTTEACAKALELDGSYLKKRFIKIERPRVPRILAQAAKDKSEVVRPAGCKSVFVKNIPYVFCSIFFLLFLFVMTLSLSIDLLLPVCIL